LDTNLQIHIITRVALQLANPLEGDDQETALTLLAAARNFVERGSRADLAITGTRGVVVLWQGNADLARVLFSRVLLTAQWRGWENLVASARFWLPLAQHADVRIVAS
jgi:hypothetical protein